MLDVNLILEILILFTYFNYILNGNVISLCSLFCSVAKTDEGGGGLLRPWFLNLVGGKGAHGGSSRRERDKKGGSS